MTQHRSQPYLFIILLAYLSMGYFFPAIGVIAIICMLAPVVMAFSNGRYWCGNYCPRGSFYDTVIAKLSPNKPIPPIFRTTAFRSLMVVFIMSVFTVQMYYAWGDWNEAGLVFLRIIFITTVIGILLAFVFHPRTWCSFCPMGTLANWASKNRPLPLSIDASCKSCGLCSKVCPMQLNPSDNKKAESFFSHPDCLKCGRCVDKCPVNALSFKSSHD